MHGPIDSINNIFLDDHFVPLFFDAQQKSTHCTQQSHSNNIRLEIRLLLELPIRSVQPLSAPSCSAHRFPQVAAILYSLDPQMDSSNL